MDGIWYDTGACYTGTCHQDGFEDWFDFGEQFRGISFWLGRVSDVDFSEIFEGKADGETAS